MSVGLGCSAHVDTQDPRYDSLSLPRVVLGVSCTVYFVLVAMLFHIFVDGAPTRSFGKLYAYGWGVPPKNTSSAHGGSTTYIGIFSKWYCKLYVVYVSFDDSSLHHVAPAVLSTLSLSLVRIPRGFWDHSERKPQEKNARKSVLSIALHVVD